MLVSLIICWLLVFVSSIILRIHGRVKTFIICTLSALWGFIVILLTFITPPGGGSNVNLSLLDVSNKADMIDAFLNSMMFFPCGMLMSMVNVKISSAIIIGALLSLLIEVMQYVLNIGRTSDLNDIIFNTLGSAIGFWFCKKIKAIYI
ncbi:hypothetical protein VAWG001_20340 [Aeromonas dhakensis]|nr:hypothetical protein VAWG001_20340 [Aeromonas dhakensis]